MEPCDEPRTHEHATDVAVSNCAPHLLLQRAIDRGDFRDETQDFSRRSFLAMGGLIGASLALAACGSTRVARLPEPEWNDLDNAASTSTLATVASTGSGATKTPSTTTPAVRPLGGGNPLDQAALPWAKPRYLWAKAPPDFTNLNPMLPVTSITVHHDGLDDVIYVKDSAAMCERIEHYRVGHRGRGWADIGYHLVIDRAGTLWQGRSIRFQGAHVKNRNEGNIGILVMGNFERQQPTTEQMKTLERVLRDLKRTYTVSTRRVYTHREWPGAETACPGKNLQPKVASLRTRLA